MEFQVFAVSWTAGRDERMWGFEIEIKSGIGEQLTVLGCITFVALEVIVKQQHREYVMGAGFVLFPPK